MSQTGTFGLIGFGPEGWGPLLLSASGMTIAVAVCGFAIGSVIGSVVAWAKIKGNLAIKGAADAYTTILRGVPDLLIVYLFYFGGSSALGFLGGLLGASGFVGMPAFATGAIAIGMISGAYQGEVYRGAFNVVNRGELEAARSVGMHPMLLFRRIIAPQTLRFAIPGLGNSWQQVLKESALISVTGLVELMRQSQIAAGSSHRPFEIFLTAGLLYLAITSFSSRVFHHAEKRATRGMRRPS